jgi:hypothetical protein
MCGIKIAQNVFRALPKVRSPFVKGRAIRLVAGLLIVAAAAVLVAAGVRYGRQRQVREALYTAFAPVRITNCTMQRYGSANDGGYLMCANFMPFAEAAYSFGIDGRDEWGCDINRATGLSIHQYDCFNTQRPACPAAGAFHAECVGPEGGTFDGRPFNTMAHQIDANGHTGKRLVVKMDVEGSEWRALATAPEHVLNAIDQMSVEFHGIEEPHFLETAARLNEFFYVAHVHQNNYECLPGYDPFPGPIVEVLFVNKRIAVANPWVDARGPLPLDAPSQPSLPDCQASPGGNEAQRIWRWTQRYARGAIEALLK